MQLFPGIFGLLKQKNIAAKSTTTHNGQMEYSGFG